MTEMVWGGNGLIVILHPRRKKGTDKDGQLQHAHGQMLGGRNCNEGSCLISQHMGGTGLLISFEFLWD